jgi:hypothetical protein
MAHECCGADKRLVLGEEYKLWSFSLCDVSRTLVIYFFLGPNKYEMLVGDL